MRKDSRARDRGRRRKGERIGESERDLTHGSWSGNIVHRKPPRGGGFLSIRVRETSVVQTTERPRDRETERRRDREKEREREFNIFGDQWWSTEAMWEVHNVHFQASFSLARCNTLGSDGVVCAWDSNWADCPCDPKHKILCGSNMEDFWYLQFCFIQLLNFCIAILEQNG